MHFACFQGEFSRARYHAKISFAVYSLYFAAIKEELVLLAASNSPNNRGLVSKHLHGYATIQFVENIRGGLFLAYDDEQYLFEQGSWFFPAHPGPYIRFHAQEPGGCWHHRHIGFSGPLVEKWRAAGIWLEKPQAAPSGESLGPVLDELIEWVRRGDTLCRWRAINGIEGLLLRLTQARSLASEENQWLQTLLEKLESQATPDFSHIAVEMGLSDTALRRRFKAATGQTMQVWVLNRKISAARALLSDTDLPLKLIAARLGYRNEYFFSRQFKAFVGVAPGAFRRSRP